MPNSLDFLPVSSFSINSYSPPYYAVDIGIQGTAYKKITILSIYNCTALYTDIHTQTL